MSLAASTTSNMLWAQTKCLWPKRCATCDDRERCPIQKLVEENAILKEEIRVSRESAEITASLVVKQFEETERVLQRFQIANAQRKAVLDSASQMAIMGTDHTGIITVFNKGAENLLFYSADEVIGQLKPTVFHDPAELKARAKMLSAGTGHEIQDIDLFFYYAANEIAVQEEWTYVRKDGLVFPVNLSINPLRDSEGAISGFLCIAVDITEKKHSEQALQESERNYRLLINNIPNIVFKGYPDGTIDFFDNKIEMLTGYRREAFLNRELKWTDLILEEDLESSRNRFLEALKGDRQYFREYRIRKKNGDIVWVQASSQIVCDENGAIDFIGGALLDITQRKLAEEALLESEEQYRTLFNSGPNPIFILDLKDLRIIDVNPAALVTYEYTKEEMLGRSFSELGEFEIQDQIVNPDTDVDWPMNCFINQKVRHCKKDGTPFFLRITACPIKYKERQAIILAATDITEAIEKDAQLFQTTKMKTLGEMSAGMAHELTQPLNAIKIGNDFLKHMIRQNRPLKSEELQRVATAVSSQVRRASDIINRLREFGRRPDFKKEPVNLNTVVDNVMQIIGHQLVLINIRVDYDLDPHLPSILANANRLEQVVFNLVTNARDAIKHLPEDSAESVQRVITLRTCVEDNDVVCAVKDTGMGIPSKVRHKIFEPFYTTKEVGDGMGLGLAITYGIVQDYGGTIDVKSEPGGGTGFYLRFAQP